MSVELKTPAAPTYVHVAAGVIRDSRGRILLARRTEGRDLAGAWEFPGGKVEKNEAVFDALKRELDEELGICVLKAVPLIKVPQHYAHKSIVLDVYEVTQFSGKPLGREKQALAWAPLAKLHAYPMPAADRPVVAALTQPALMAITPAFNGDKKRFLARIEKQLKAGVGIVQLRSDLPMSLELRQLAADVRTLCLQHDAKCFINQHIDLARDLGCGVHLKSSQLHQSGIEKIISDMLTSAACHHKADLLRAQSINVDFALLSPVAKTTSHPDVEPIGWQGFAALRAEVSMPIFALGGLNVNDLRTARAHGAQGVAGISQF
jgi:8-oxo-dGTP diphosphatase